ncbi:MAG: multicopper oxidase domain-containing protein, partial [Rhodothermales bacterium]|nr:multicopper oxidase domain-containing protein [Rhodothermales bacterium]
MPRAWVALLVLLAGPMPRAVAAAQPAHPHPEPSRTAASAPAVARAETGLSVLPNHAVAPGTVEVTLTAAPARAGLLPGMETEVYAYNGRIPGPTLEVREGDRVVVRFRNELPEPTTIHWHGLHLPIDADGSPLHPVAPGEAYDYVFTIPAGSAGTYWYH